MGSHIGPVFFFFNTIPASFALLVFSSSLLHQVWVRQPLPPLITSTSAFLLALALVPQKMSPVAQLLEPQLCTCQVSPRVIIQHVMPIYSISLLLWISRWDYNEDSTDVWGCSWVRSAHPLKKNFITSCHIVPLFLKKQAQTLWICLQIECWGWSSTQNAVYAEKCAVNPLQVIKPVERRAWN